VRVEAEAIRAGEAYAVQYLPGESARYADTPAGALPEESALWRDQLLDGALYDMICDYYAKDFKLYNRSIENELEVAGA
jgi:hypothetical protein